MKSYDEIDYSKDKYEGDFPLLEIVILVIVFTAWYLLK